MEYSHRYPAYPTQEVAAELERHIDIHRPAYSYTRYQYTHLDADSTGSAYKHHSRLPDWKDEFPVFTEGTQKRFSEPSLGSTTTSRTSLSRKKTGTRSGISSGNHHVSSRA